MFYFCPPLRPGLMAKKCLVFGVSCLGYGLHLCYHHHGQISKHQTQNTNFMLDYHIHTRLCNHAHGAMADYAKQAISLGLREICFLDHLTLGQRGKKSSMAVNEVGLYYQAAQYIKQRFCDRIQVKVGLETDYDPQFCVAPTERLDWKWVEGLGYCVLI